VCDALDEDEDEDGFDLHDSEWEALRLMNLMRGLCQAGVEGDRERIQRDAMLHSAQNEAKLQLKELSQIAKTKSKSSRDASRRFESAIEGLVKEHREAKALLVDLKYIESSSQMGLHAGKPWPLQLPTHRPAWELDPGYDPALLAQSIDATESLIHRMARLVDARIEEGQEEGDAAIRARLDALIRLLDRMVSEETRGFRDRKGVREREEAIAAEHYTEDVRVRKRRVAKGRFKFQRGLQDMEGRVQKSPYAALSIASLLWQEHTASMIAAPRGLLPGMAQTAIMAWEAWGRKDRIERSNAMRREVEGPYPLF